MRNRVFILVLIVIVGFWTPLYTQETKSPANEVQLDAKHGVILGYLW